MTIGTYLTTLSLSLSISISTPPLSLFRRRGLFPPLSPAHVGLPCGPWMLQREEGVPRPAFLRSTAPPAWPTPTVQQQIACWTSAAPPSRLGAEACRAACSGPSAQEHRVAHLHDVFTPPANPPPLRLQTTGLFRAAAAQCAVRQPLATRPLLCDWFHLFGPRGVGGGAIAGRLQRNGKLPIGSRLPEMLLRLHPRRPVFAPRAASAGTSCLPRSHTGRGSLATS